MQKHNEDRKILSDFWKANKERCIAISSIDLVYNEYLEYLKLVNIDRAINKYIFRTYIRKNGYGNQKKKNKQKASENLSNTS